MSDRMSEDMPEHMPEHMPEDMPDRMPDRMPEDLPVRKCINVMVGITRSKVIYISETTMVSNYYLWFNIKAKPAKLIVNDSARLFF